MKKLSVESFIGEKVEYDQHGGQFIWGLHKGDEMQMLLSVRGWGAIQQLFEDGNDAANFQDEMGEWIADAINQKLNNRLMKLAHKTR